MLKLEGISRFYDMPSYKIEALKDISVEFRECEFVSILGPSGCGKSTLLNIIGGLDRYSTGLLAVDGVTTKEFTDNHWDAYRNSVVGFVFQSYNLIPHLTVYENIELSLTLSGLKKKDRIQKVKKALESINMVNESRRKPGQLSGGQSQRVAIARALVNEPTILLADEPTGALDSELSLQILDTLKEISKSKLVIMVTHNRELANLYSTRIIELKDGRIIKDSNPFIAKNNLAKVEIAQSNTIQGINTQDLKEENHDKQIIKNKPKAVFKHQRKSNYHPNDKKRFIMQNIIMKRKDLPSFSKHKPHKKVSMGMGTAISISFKNMLMKKRRTILTSVAGSIGIIGIALVLSLSYGYNIYIDKMQTAMLANIPIGVYEYSLDYNAAFDTLEGFSGISVEGDFSETDSIIIRDKDEFSGLSNVMNLFTDSISRNRITPGFIDYLNGIDKSLVDGVNYIYGTRINLVSEYYDDNGIKDYADVSQVPSTTTAMTIATTVLGGNGQEPPQWNQLPGDKDFVLRYYDVLSGRYPNNRNEVVLVVDGYNSLDIQTLQEFKIDVYERDSDNVVKKDTDNSLITKESIPLNEIIGKSFKLVKFNEYFIENEAGKFEIPSEDPILLNALYHSENSETLEIVGVLRIKPESTTDLVGTNICFLPELSQFVLTDAMESNICNAQKSDTSVSVIKGHIMPPENDDDNIITFFMTGLQKTGYLKSLAVDPVPTHISIYPKDFSSKSQITEYLDSFNNSVEEEYRINYFDISEMFIHNMRIAVDLITKVLIAVASISLIVSCAMISIMTGNSVAERAREIGILRSIGARRFDIFSIFNAETSLNGLFSGFIAIGLCYALIPFANYLIGSATGIFGLMKLNPIHAVILILISFTLTFISGLIPSQMAANKNVVDALRLE